MCKIAGVILNPVAGKKKGKHLLSDFLESLTRLGYQTRVCVTLQRNDAINAAHRFSRECDIVCCIGGDGTLSETISGIMRSEKKPALCYLPAGSTNDFASVCGIKGTIPAATKLLKKDSVYRLDIGQLDDRFFTYIASFGIFTRTSYSADQVMKNLIGHFAYILEGAKEIPNLGKKYHVTVTHDEGTIEGDYVFGGIANSTSFGGVFRLSNNCVTLDDGKFELLLIRQPKTIDNAIRILSMMKTGKFDGNLIHFVKTKHVKIEATEPIAWCVDGEFAGDRQKVDIRNHARALPLYSNPAPELLTMKCQNCLKKAAKEKL